MKDPVLLMCVAFVVFAMLRFSIALMMFGCGLVYLWASRQDIGLIVDQTLNSSFQLSVLLAVPMFILAGELMTRGGVTQRLVNFSSVLVGHIKGGLAQVSVLANVIMAGMSGSAAADLAATGSLLIPGMVKRGYPPEFASAVIASASTIGPVIPPSLPMVIIGSMVSVSVGQLFMGGVVPGLLMGVAMMVVVYRYAHRAGLPVERRATRKEVVHALWDGALALAMPAIVLGSIITGFATPTEAAVVAVVYAFILGVFVYRQISWSALPEIFTNVAITSAAVMVTVAAAQLFGWITAAEGLGNAIGAWLTSLTSNHYVILLVINVILLILGMFMEPIPIMLLTVPILFPVVTKLGIDPVHFGVVVTLNLMIGCLTPPVGLNLFLASAISGVPVMRVARAATPFIIVLLVVLALITYIPQLVLWLPHLTQAGS